MSTLRLLFMFDINDLKEGGREKGNHPTTRYSTSTVQLNVSSTLPFWMPVIVS